MKKLDWTCKWKMKNKELWRSRSVWLLSHWFQLRQPEESTRTTRPRANALQTRPRPVSADSCSPTIGTSNLPPSLKIFTGKFTNSLPLNCYPIKLFYRENLSVPSNFWYLKAVIINLCLFVVLFFLTTPAIVVNIFDSLNFSNELQKMVKRRSTYNELVFNQFHSRAQFSLNFCQPFSCGQWRLWCRYWFPTLTSGSLTGLGQSKTTPSCRNRFSFFSSWSSFFLHLDWQGNWYFSNC